VLLVANQSCGYFRQTSKVNLPAAKASPSAIDQANRDEPQTKSPLPSPTGYVNDYAGVFDTTAGRNLEARLAELKKLTAIEFAVVTVDTTGDKSIYEYSLAVARGWGIGPKDKSTGGGLLLLLAVKDRQWRLQVSRNLEKELPDDVCRELGEKSTQLYQRGAYAQGLDAYVEAIIERLQKTRGFSMPRRNAA